MPSQILITEPHPTVAPNTYTYSGRGGAGNIFRAPVTTPAAGITTPLQPASVNGPRRFYSGIGGAGNRHTAQEQAVRTFEEDFKRQEVRDRTATGHVGIGGAGNVMRKGSDASSVLSSESSTSEVSSLKSLKKRGGSVWRRVTSRHN
ncbi:uncharacterized protein LY79DRAFT_528556 [Colletotrichum navitas]|uniref:Uncharacterized protein n=1 Tax=Colletotrichum navitas TaxID=681940 RepID=A0AAD8PLK4_9PEZI|nr:uncharacterized protein LY79DRAFT_528556 [Colletotrichum navitas]KAK1569502.1 hypothetical protein LY79DRAFT_528556 [Colletotrichum navitas]